MAHLPVSTVILCCLAAGVLTLIGVGVASAARRAAWRSPRGVGFVTASLLGVWLAGVAAMSLAGVFELVPGKPPREPLLPITLLTTLLLLGRTRWAKDLIANVPVWQPVAIQVVRVFVELAFWKLHQEGPAPVQVTFEGRNLDVLVALSAPIIATLLWFSLLGPRVTILWNLFGIAMLLNAIGTVATSIPGPLHLNWPGEPFTALGRWPVIWIPAFFAPVALFLHTVSIRQALAQRCRASCDRSTRTPKGVAA